MCTGQPLRWCLHFLALTGLCNMFPSSVGFLATCIHQTECDKNEGRTIWHMVTEGSGFHLAHPLLFSHVHMMEASCQEVSCVMRRVTQDGGASLPVAGKPLKASFQWSQGTKSCQQALAWTRERILPLEPGSNDSSCQYLGCNLVKDPAPEDSGKSYPVPDPWQWEVIKFELLDLGIISYIW